MTEIPLFSDLSNIEQLKEFGPLGFGITRFDEKLDGRLAGITAAKKSVLKLLPHVPLNSITISKYPSGEPYVEFNDQTYSSLLYDGVVNVPVSITHDNGIALSAALLDHGSHGNLRLGIDLTFATRMGRILSTGGRHVFTEKEMIEINNSPLQAAKRWAIKEASSKILGTGFSYGVNRKSIETHEQGLGTTIILSETPTEYAKNHNLTHWNIQTHDNGEAVVAIIIAHS